MLENLEVRKAENGFILIINTEDESKEYIYDTERKLIKAIKDALGSKAAE